MLKFIAKLKPTWRQGFLMLATFSVGSILVWIALLMDRTRDDASLVDTWINLLDRCRVSIEDRQPLDTDGLLPADQDADPLRHAASRERYWSPILGGRFVIRETEGDIATGRALRACEVTVGDWRKPLSTLELERLTFAFMQERRDLVERGTEEARDPGPGSGAVTAGFGPPDPNPIGCNVMTAFFADPRRGSFWTISGEQSVGCPGGPSLIDAKAI